jgi:Holliday junction DNA helicase RuvA
VIATLEGTVTWLGLDRAGIRVGGVGFLVFATPRHLGTLHMGEKAAVAISTIVREDAILFFAFPDDDEREVFDSIRAVSGIGPKTALGLLAVHSASDLRQAIQAGDVKTISRGPGVGPKTAQRLVLELAGKLVPAEVPGSAKTAAPGGEHRAQVVNALLGLGYPVRAAEKAVEQVLAQRGGTPWTGADLPQVLRAALQTFAGVT